MLLRICHLQLMAANQRLYQAEQTSATAVANAAQLQGEVLRLSNQMDELRQDLQTQSTLAETQQVCAIWKNIAVIFLMAWYGKHRSVTLCLLQEKLFQVKRRE